MSYGGDSRCKNYLVKIFQERTMHKPTQVKICQAPKVGWLIYRASGYFQQSLSYLEVYNPARHTAVAGRTGVAWLAVWKAGSCMPEAAVTSPPRVTPTPVP